MAAAGAGAVRAVLLTAPHDLAVRELPRPRGNGRALVRIEQVGICGTDVKIYKGDIPVTYPRIPGHELVGRVEEAGSRNLVPVGTRVLVDPAVSCGHCRLCRLDRPNLCPNGALLGRDLDGGLVEVMAVDENALHPIPDSLSAEEAALLQVMGTCVHAQSGLHTEPGDGAVVIGLGVAGLLHLQLLRARGVQPIVGIARSPSKQALGMELGATAVTDPDHAEEVVRSVLPGGAPLVVEAVGSVATLGLGIRLAALGATLLVFGTVTASRAEDLPFYQLYYKELTILNPRAALPRDYDRSIALAASGQVRLAPLFTAWYLMEEVDAAFHEAASETRGLKVALKLPGAGAPAAAMTR